MGNANKVLNYPGQRRDFLEYLARQPQVYEKFVSITFQLISSGHRHYSADAILHIIRYDQAIRKDLLEMYKINNNFSSQFARKFIEDYPEYSNFFELRTLKMVPITTGTTEDRSSQQHQGEIQFQ